MRLRGRGKLVCATGTWLLLGCASITWGSLTNVRPPRTGEASHTAILANTYGGVFAPDAVGSTTFTNGTITATRMEDNIGKSGIGNNTNLVTGTPNPLTTDQRWQDGIAITSAIARFAGYQQEFGFDDGNGYVKLFDATTHGSNGFNITGSASHHFSLGTPWNWVRFGTGNLYYSENSRNPDQLDHLVTYRITGLHTVDSVWMLFWEDLPGPFRGSGGSDRDFNDLAVEVRGHVASVVPIPGAELLGALGMGLCSLFEKRRKPLRR